MHPTSSVRVPGAAILSHTPRSFLAVAEAQLVKARITEDCEPVFHGLQGFRGLPREI
jgi:hypothetical protein